MTSPLPSSGSEREIFLRALREYSEQCRPPALTASCPFAHDLPGGIRGCLEECMVLLTEYEAPPPVDEIRFGNSLSLRPRLPRARRGPVPRSKPFDAGEIYHTDSRLEDVTQWRVTALLEALKRILTWEDGFEEDVANRSDLAQRVFAELDRRGIPSEKIIRYGLAAKIAATVFMTAIASRVISGFDDGAPPIAARLPAWIPVLGLDNLEPVEWDDMTRAMLDAFNPHRIRQLVAWVKSAPLEDVIALTPPQRDLSECSLVDDADSACQHECEWLLDRFTTTYLWQWKLSSMKLEWKYQHGLLASACNNSDMASVRISENDLAKQIAAQSVDDNQDSHRAGFGATDYVPVALNLLGSGRRKEAAAIFEATASLSPRDPFALNNWAFCLMPDSPERALDLFERAAHNGLGDNLMLIGNRLWCLLRLNRYSSALSLSDAVVGSLAARPVQPAHMWSFPGESIEYISDLRSYVVGLITSVVANSADDVITERWKPILDDVRTAISQEPN